MCSAENRAHKIDDIVTIKYHFICKHDQLLILLRKTPPQKWKEINTNTQKKRSFNFSNNFHEHEKMVVVIVTRKIDDKTMILCSLYANSIIFIRSKCHRFVSFDLAHFHHISEFNWVSKFRTKNFSFKIITVYVQTPYICQITIRLRLKGDSWFWVRPLKCALLTSTITRLYSASSEFQLSQRL